MIKVQLTPDQRSKLQRLRRDPTLKPAERDRVEMVMLSDKGWSPPSIASHLEYNPATIRRVLRQFEDAGVEGLRHRRPGPSPDIDRRHQVQTALCDLLSQERTWTSRQLAEALGQYDIRLSPRQVRKYLQAMGARYLRTARTLRHKQDPQQVERAQKTLAVLKKKPSHDS